MKKEFYKPTGKGEAITYGHLLRGLKANYDFFHSPDALRTTIQYATEVGKELMRVNPSVQMVSGDGFPYYMARLDSPPVPVPEIHRFNQEEVTYYEGLVMSDDDFGDGSKLQSLTELRQTYPSAGTRDRYGVEKAGKQKNAPLVDLEQALPLSKHVDKGDMEVDSHEWPCPHCVATNNLPNLRDPCGPCNLTSFKPRDILRAFHDVDIQVIVDGNAEDEVGNIRSTLHAMGVPCNDESLEAVIRGAGQLFPVDVTVMSRIDYLNGLALLREPGDWDAVRVDAIKLWLKDEKKRWTLGRDFVFSMEPLVARSVETDVLAAFLQTRRDFLTVHPLEDVLNQLSLLPRSHGRMMQSPEIRNGVIRHLQSGDAPFLTTAY